MATAKIYAINQTDMTLLCLTALVATQPVSPSFHTQVEPRIDPVFGDTADLKRSLDRFMRLDSEMDKVADQFSSAVHDTLAELSKLGPSSDLSAADGKDKREKVCPSAVASAYERARSAGTFYLELGRDLDVQMREIRTAESYGDTVALTPDYRLKVDHAKRDYAELLRGLREMQVAFHDQLETEMRYAGCDTARLGAVAGTTAEAPDPTADQATVKAPPTGADTASFAAASSVATIASVVVDTTHCGQQSRLTVDGKLLGPVEANRRTLVRLPQGPHDFCVLPSSDPRTCDATGTIRHAYVHDGWVLEVRCE